MVDNFVTHCFIEFYYRTERGFLNEHNSVLTFEQLNETYGVFKGCETLANKIYKKIDNLNNSKNQITIQVNNEWIDNIKILLFNDSTVKTSASFSTRSSLSEQKYNPLIININLYYCKDRRKTIVRLMHELTHAYENYNRIINGKTNIDDEAKRLGYYLNNAGSYEGFKKYLSYMLFYITSFERNAYMAELKGELVTCDEHFYNINEIVKFLRKTEICRNFETLTSYIHFFTEIKDLTTQTIILEWLTDISNLSFNTYNKFVKYLQQKKYEIERKINIFVPKIAYEYLTFGNTLKNVDGKLPKIE